MKTTIAAVIAGLLMFVWGFVSWTVLPWRDIDVHEFADEATTLQFLLDQAPETGLYYIPSDEADYSENNPNAFINIKKQGHQKGMGHMMISGIINNIVMALMLACLLRMTSGLSYGQRVGFTMLTGVLIGVAANFPYWNWFGFPTAYTIVQIVDSVVGWTLAGLVLAKLVPQRAR